MKEKNCDKKNPLIRNGTAVTERLPEGLSPDYVKIDEKTIADFLMFITTFSKHIKYYSFDNLHFGQWNDFFTGDVSVLIAKLAGKRIQAYQPYFLTILDEMAGETNSLADVIDLSNDIPHLKSLFDFLFSICHLLDQEIYYLPDDLELKATALKIIEKDFSRFFKIMSGMYKAGIEMDMIAHNQKTAVIANHPVDIVYTQDIFKNNIAGEWFANAESSFELFYQNLSAPDYNTYYKAVPLSWSVQDVKFMVSAGLKNLENIFDQLIKTLSAIIGLSQDFFQQTITTWPSHQPHMAMFIAFLRLYLILQQQMNSLGPKHLEFYYKEVLRLKPKNAQPNFVHLIIELAKNTEKLSLPAGTKYKAGKDSQGKDILYEQTEEYTINKTNIAFLSGLYKKEGKFTATPVVNSLDGMGEEPVEEGASWSPFGVDLPAQIGFAIDSPLLLMREGTRTITIEFDAKDSSVSINVSEMFEAFVSLGEDWSEAVAVEAADTDKDFGFEIKLLPEMPPVIPFSAKYQGIFKPEHPVLKVILKDAGANYVSLTGIVLTNMTLRTEVEGMKNLTIQNDFSVMDPSKPFLPFGPSPIKGSSLIIGSNEIFQKRLTEINFDITWGNGFEDSEPHDQSVAVSLLTPAEWKSIEDNFEFFTQAAIVIDEPNPLQEGVEKFTYQPDSTYQAKDKYGFLKLTLNSDFGHKDYLKGYTETILNFSKGSETTIDLPDKPYTPLIEELKMGYTAEVNVAFDNPSQSTGTAGFYHIHPFGVAEMTNIAERTGNLPTFIPEYHHEGEFYIGLQKFLPGQFVSVLFQLDEGTANPLKEQPEVKWHYLKDDLWEEFDKTQNEITDTTAGLIRSGIIRFKIPKTANTSNNLLSKEAFWIRASVDVNSDAVSRMIAVLAQAVQATLVMEADVKSILKNQAAPGSISKMLIRNAAVKAVQQPFETYGGKPAPKDEEFNVSTSERLRHKNRALTIWDYERLTLEKFSDIYKIKCLNHTKATEVKDYEMHPGHVTMVVIPKINKKTTFYLNRPYASLATLNQIEEYLRKKTSPFVRLKVLNLRFEPIRVEVNVAFHDDRDPNIYEEVLNEDIKKFLSPWAYEEGAISQLKFGGSLQQSAILKYIEDREYVDNVTDFKIYHDKEDNGNETLVEEAIASTARSALVSAENHLIKNEALVCNA